MDDLGQLGRIFGTDYFGTEHNASLRRKGPVSDGENLLETAPGGPGVCDAITIE
jgi:hypothetical protein